MLYYLYKNISGVANVEDIQDELNGLLFGNNNNDDDNNDKNNNNSEEKTSTEEAVKAEPFVPRSGVSPLKEF